MAEYTPNYTDLLSTDAKTVHFFETGEGFEELDEAAQILAEYVKRHGPEGAIPSVADRWMLGQYQDETTPSVVVPIVKDTFVPRVLDILLWDPTGGNR